MNNKFKYHFNNSLKILFKYYYGHITINDIESSWEYAFKNNLIPKDTKGFVLDYTNATLDMKPDEHTAIADFYKKHIEIFRNYKIGIVTDNPKDVVIPILVETKDDGYESSPFSSMEAAIEWVLH